jgi:hypothetical protein
VRLSRSDERSESQADVAAAGISRGASFANEAWVASAPGTVFRQPKSRRSTADPNLLNAEPPQTATMSRADFTHIMTHQLGATRVASGTLQEQTASSTPQGGAAADGISLPSWQAWDPGTTSPLYQDLLNSLRHVEARVGGYPEVREVLFFKVSYAVNAKGVGIPQPEVGATYGAGRLTVYERAAKASVGLPTGRSTAAARYPPVVIVMVRDGETPGAPVPLPSRAQSAQRLFTHELGHGLAEAAMATDADTFKRYRREIGWMATDPNELFDIGVKAVQTAIAADSRPPIEHQITEQNWNSSKWLEQPLTAYMVAGGPAEDFAEAAMAYVEEPSLLAARSPARFRFLDGSRAAWLPQLKKRPPVGDFFTTDRIRRTA